MYVGFISALLHHQDPTIINFLEPRSHLAHSLCSNTMALFPTSTRVRTPKTLHIITVDIFSSCRGIDTGTLMVQCDSCSNCNHADCLTIGKEDLEASTGYFMNVAQSFDPQSFKKGVDSYVPMLFRLSLLLRFLLWPPAPNWLGRCKYNVTG